jgi:quinone-modifying oxidoreductase subunit QmoA
MNDSSASHGERPTLVIGGGIAGLSAAVEASEAGREVILVERNHYVGGRVAQMSKYFPKFCPPMCGVEIHLKRLRTTERVKILTGAEVRSVSGTPGAFRVEVRMAARGVNDRCTACGECEAVCPKSRPNAFNYEMDTTKAVYLPHDTAFPFRYAIDFERCDGASCAKCVEACAYDAIDLDDKEHVETLEVASIVVATGWKPYAAADLPELGGGKIPNVIRSVEIERLAAPGGPTGGKVLRPSDGEPPQHVAFVQCAGSRDETHLAHCSSICCLASLKQARYVLDEHPEARVTIFYIDIRASGRNEKLFAELQDHERVTLVKGKVAKIEEAPSGGDVQLTVEDALSNKKLTVKASMAVLAVGMVPESQDAGFPAAWGTDDHGFLTPNEASVGVFPAGCAKKPAEVSSCVKDATAAALRTLQCAREVAS